MSLLRRTLCRFQGHGWEYMFFGLQRQCQRCGAKELKDLMRGGWVRLPRVRKK